MHPEEFKFQRDTSGQKVLFYNEDKTIKSEIDGEFAKITSSALGLEPNSKCYAAAYIDSDGKLIIGQKLPDQNW